VNDHQRKIRGETIETIKRSGKYIIKGSNPENTVSHFSNTECSNTAKAQG